MLLLDEEDGLIAERRVGSVDEPTRPPINLRPILMGLMVVVLGGGLGTASYFLSDMDTRDIIALLDISDQPKLSLEMPRGEMPPGESGSPTPPPTIGGGLLTPPGGPSVIPLPKGEAAGIAAMPMTPPLKPEAPPKAEPAPPAAVAVAPPIVQAMPEQPLPRNPDQPPTYASLPARLTDAKPLGPAPLEQLLRQSAYGPLPVVARDGRQPWKAYARPFDAPTGKPRLAVIVTGLGLDKDATEAAIAKLPADVTLAFSPYAGALDKWVKKARDAGHEVMLTLPAETASFPARDPGPWGLLVANPVEENISRLERVLGRAVGYVGVLAPEGSFTGSPKLAPVLMALKERGLLYVGQGATADAGLPVAPVTASLDVDTFRDAIETRLTMAARTAKDSGRGIVVVSPRPVVFDRLVGWLDRLGEQGIALAPASGVVKQGGK
ncbi:MAG: divergent polysaccharide deacetylase family protein [Rhodospirillaceae bacterium]|nr:divergent polysaccharide deacetylase family protein [Rhodospirillales bacterium]